LPAHARSQPASASFGARLKWIRGQKKWSQTELAEKAGLTPAAISQIESDERQPSFNTLSRLAQALGVTVGYLVGDEAELPSELQAFFRDLEKLDSSDVQQLKDLAAFLRNKARQSSE
jgi:transcriptional regulator with XRE-family HTH domain